MSEVGASPADAAGSVLLVFAKPPEPGRVKTRLVPALSPEASARLYEAFLRDALVQYTALGVQVRLYWAPPVEDVPPDLVPDSVDVRVQKGDDLGARMRSAFREVLDDGAERAVIIGTDHPTLPSAFIEQAFGALQEPESMSIGPSADGGYYLLGMNAFYPQLFEGMHYSHADVFSDTLKRAARIDAQITILPSWYDVDTPAALRRCIRDLESEDTAAPHTRRVLADLDLERVPGAT